MTWTSVGSGGSCTDYHVSIVTGQLLVKLDSMHYTMSCTVYDYHQKTHTDL